MSSLLDVSFDREGDEVHVLLSGRMVAKIIEQKREHLPWTVVIYGEAGGDASYLCGTLNQGIITVLSNLWDSEIPASVSLPEDPYQFTCNGVRVDPYRIARIYRITDPVIFQALKKLLRCGRKHKDMATDVREAVTSLLRWEEMNREDYRKQLED